MSGFSRVRSAVIALAAATTVTTASASAWAFSQTTVQSNGTGSASSALAGSDNQFTSGQGAQPFGPSGPTVQFNVQQGQFTPFGFQSGRNNFGGNGASPTDPYSHPGGKFGE